MATPPITFQTKISKFDASNFHNGDVWADVTTLVNGNIVASWQSNGQDGSGYACVARIFSPDGNPITDEFVINTYTASDQANPRLAPLKNGGFVIVWHSIWQEKAGGYNAWGCFGQLYNDKGDKVGSEFQINTFTNDNQGGVVATGLDDGGFATAWFSYTQDGSGGGVYAQVFNTDGSKRGNEFRVNNIIPGFQEVGGIAALKNGGFVVTWTDNIDNVEVGNGNYFSFYDKNGVNLAPSVKFSDSSLLNYPSPVIAIDDSFAITWTESNADGNGKGVFLRIYDNGGNAKTQKLLVNTTVNGDQKFSDIVYLGKNRILVSWEGPGDNGNELYAREFSALDGSPLTNEYRLNTETSGNQRAVSLSRSLSGDPVVVWNTSGTNGSADGIYLSIQDQPKVPVVRGNSLYTIVDGPSWTQAEANSVKLGGHLVALSTKEEDAFVWDTFKSNYWIGLTDQASPGNWKWINGDTSTYTNWAPGNPNNAGGAQHYAWSWNDAPGKWDDNINDSIIPGKGITETTFIRRGDSAYVIVQGPTWEEAEANAVKLGGHLVTINDAEENSFLVNFLNKETDLSFYIGATDKEQEGVWKDPTGNLLTYTNWHTWQGGGEPNNNNGGEDFGVIYSGNYAGTSTNKGKWNDISFIKEVTNGHLEKSTSCLIVERFEL